MRRYLLLIVAIWSVITGTATTRPATAFSDACADKAPARYSAIANRHVEINPSAEIPQHKLAAGHSVHVNRLFSPASRAVEMDKLPAQAIQIDIDKAGTFYSASVTTINVNGTTIEIGNFGGRGVTLKGELDPTTGHVSIPRQSAYVSPTYGNCDIVSFDIAANVYNNDDPITGQIENGILTLEPWVLLITSGEYANYALGSIVGNTTFQAPNATRKATLIPDPAEGETTQPEDKEESYPVYCEQSADNQINVYNFLGAGYKEIIRINGDKTLSIVPQYLFSHAEYGSFFYYKYDATNKQIYFYAPISGTTDGNCLSWGEAIINTSNGKYYAAKFRKSSIQLDFDIKYPAAATQSGFKGSGTEADPYLIETLADLIALSDSVNFNTPIPAGAKYGKAFEGKFFKQTKAINAKGVNFPPIGGNDDLFRFAGTYDGGKKAISNLTIDTGIRGYAALFGAADTVAVIKNVTLSSPNVRSIGYYYTGSVAANCMGLIENCTVTNAKIEGTLVVGGVAGSAGPIHNCSFTGNITGESQVGGVIAVTRDSCSFLSATNTIITLTGSQSQAQMGGIAGTLTYHRGGAITDSYFSGELRMTRTTQFAGGIVGAVTNAKVERCFSLAKITNTYSSGSAMGGIVGGAISTTINDCYFAGENLVRGTLSGGIIGYNMNAPGDGFMDKSVINNSYISGLVYPSAEREYNPYVGYFDTRAGGNGPELNNCYYDDQMLPVLKVKTGAKPSLDFTGEKPNLSGFSTDVWSFTQGQYPRLKSIEKNAAAYVSAAAITFANERENVETLSKSFTGSTANSVKWWTQVNGKNVTDGNGLIIDQASGQFMLNGSFATDTIVAVNGNISKFFIVKLAPDNLFEGAGSAENPYLLNDKDDLIRLSNATVINKLSFNGTYFKITADIDVQKDEAFQGIGAPGSSGDKYGFGGILDGDNHYIHNIRMIMCDVDENGAITAAGKKNTQYGFVNNLKAIGTVRNVRIASDCEFSFYSRGAAVVGYNYGGLIENCRNYADVRAYSGTVGGITSYNGTSKTTNAVVRNCYNAGKIITGYQFAGGITANNYGLIENCQNTGEVCAEILSTNYAENKLNTSGGIAHANFGTVRNVLNTGYIHSGKYVGGILGWFNNKGGNIMASALNLGIVRYDAYEEGTIGNLVGKMYQEGTIADSYYDAQLSTENATHSKAHEGAFGLSTETLTSGTPIEGLDATYWLFEKGKYPMLRSFTDEAGAQAGAMSVVYFADNSRSDSIKSDCDLYQADGLAWSMASGQNAFSVKGNSILFMDPAETLTDTIIATYQGYVKRIPVTATPDSVPAPAIRLSDDDNSTVLLECALADVTFHYAFNGDTPTAASESTTGSSVKVPAGTKTISVIAVKHNYYASPVTSLTLQTTGIDSTVAGKEIAKRTFTSPDGIIHSNPVTGLNIVTTVYTDGTQSITKEFHK